VNGFVIHLRQHLTDECLVFAQNPEKQVFGIYVGHAKVGCLIAGEEHGSPGTFCETLKHGCLEVVKITLSEQVREEVNEP
jgi:hypothetical protein